MTQQAPAIEAESNRVVIAAFSTPRIAARIAPSILLGLALAAGAIALIPGAVEGATPRNVIRGAFLLIGFAIGALWVFSRDLSLLLRRGPAVSLLGGELTVFTGRFVTIPLAELMRASGRGAWNARVNLHDDQGRKISVRADLFDRSAAEVAAAINAQLTPR